MEEEWHKQYMPKYPGGGAKITGDDERDPVTFHKQLEEDRIHSLEDLKAVLQPLEDDRHFERTTLPNKDLEAYLTHPESIHWGNPQYEFTKYPETTGYIQFHYSPWLNEEKDILIQGRVTLNKGVEPSIFDTESHEGYGRSIDLVLEGNELCEITITTNPALPPLYQQSLEYLIGQSSNFGR